MKRDDFSHGFPEQIWHAAKEEARQAMIDVARRSDMMSYTDLVCRITSCRLEPRDPRLAYMLGEISSEEDEAGRGLLTAVVVRKDGPMRPGFGFFKLAQERGRDVSDEERCWTEELQTVHGVWG